MATACAPMSLKPRNNAESSLWPQWPIRPRSRSSSSQRAPQRLLIFCDEAAELANPVAALDRARTQAQGIDVLIGPEGGFAEEERTLLLRQPHILRLSLGPRILRADTAAVAALALVQATLGDWSEIHGDV